MIKFTKKHSKMWKSSHFSIVFCGVYCPEFFVFPSSVKKYFGNYGFPKPFYIFAQKICADAAYVYYIRCDGGRNK